MSNHGLRDYREKAFYTNTSEQNSDIFLFGKQFWVVWTIVHPYKNCTHRFYRGVGCMVKSAKLFLIPFV